MATETKVKPKFEELMGFAQKPPRPPSHGIVADWTQLPALTKPFREGWKLGYHSTNPILSTSSGIKDWVYDYKKNDNDHLSIRIEVYQEGQEGAIKEMISVGHSSNLNPNPFCPAPESIRLGDFTGMFSPVQVIRKLPPGWVFWVYYNVFAVVRTTTESIDVMPIARVIQAFMEQHVTTDLPAHLPAVTGFTAPSKPVHVGEKFTVRLLTGPNASVADWRISIDHEGDLLEGRDTNDPLVGLFKAEAPGQAVVEALAFDQKTLLSKRLECTIEILPAQGK